MLTGRLQERFGEGMPGASQAEISRKFQMELSAGEEVESSHLRMFARLLSFNSELLGSDYVGEMQSHWNGISRQVANESNISFFVPCLRLRWRCASYWDAYDSMY